MDETAKGGSEAGSMCAAVASHREKGVLILTVRCTEVPGAACCCGYMSKG